MVEMNFKNEIIPLGTMYTIGQLLPYLQNSPPLDHLARERLQGHNRILMILPPTQSNVPLADLHGLSSKN